MEKLKFWKVDALLKLSKPRILENFMKQKFGKLKRRRIEELTYLEGGER